MFYSNLLQRTQNNIFLLPRSAVAYNEMAIDIIGYPVNHNGKMQISNRSRNQHYSIEI